MNVLELRRRTLGKGVYKKTVEGNPAIAQGSLARMYPGITMQGWTEQAQYEGKNLLSVDVGQEVDGVVVTDSATFEEDGVHAVFESIVSGEARDIYMYGNSHTSVEDGYVEVPILTPGDYRLVNDNIGISLYVVAWRNGASVVLGYADNATTKITIQDGDKFRIFLRCNIIGDTDVKIHPMIVKEGEDTTQYEPYTGGQPSPNPDYPQEIVSAGNMNEETQKYEYQVKLTGKNLFDAEYFRTTLDWKPPADENGYPYIPIYIGKGKKITISTDGTPAKGLGFYCAISRTNKGTSNNVYTWIYHSNNANLIKTNVSFSVIEDDYIYFVLNTGHGNIEKFLNAFTNFQIEISAQRTEYQPYKEQTVLITSDRPLTKWDRLEKRNGQWGWVYKSMEITLDGSEEWGVYAAYEGFSVGYIFDTPRLRAEGFCESFICETAQYNVGKDTALWLGANNYSVYAIRIPQYNEELPDSGLQDWKDWLSENPLTILTYADEETFVPLSESEQEHMNALHTFRPTTVLNNDCNCNMSLTYKTKKSMQSAPGGGILKADGVISKFIFPVKWNQANKIVLKISGISSNQSIFVCGANRQNIWIGLNNDGVMSMIGLKKAVYNGAPENEIVDGKYHEMIFTFEKPVQDTNISNIWDSVWSKNIIYHEIMFYDDDELLSDCVPYYKGAGYMLDKKNNIVIRASDPDEYQFA